MHKGISLQKADSCGFEGSNIVEFIKIVRVSHHVTTRFSNPREPLRVQHFVVFTPPNGDDILTMPREIQDSDDDFDVTSPTSDGAPSPGNKGLQNGLSTTARDKSTNETSSTGG